jgi:rhamnosyltransferase
LARRVDRLVPIAPASFNHGATRNLGIEHCRGDLVWLLVQDALPVSDDWLIALIRPLREDDHVAGAYARQIPRPEADAITRYYLGGYQACSEMPRTVSVASAEDFARLSAFDRLALCTFDNVCSCVRRSVWQVHPLPVTSSAEDVAWAREALLAGHRLAYEPWAAVVHSHHRSARYELDRTYMLHQRLHKLFGLTTVPTARHLARAIMTSLVAHGRCVVADGGPGQSERGSLVARGLARRRVSAGPVPRRPFEPHRPISAPTRPGVTAPAMRDCQRSMT